MLLDLPIYIATTLLLREDCLLMDEISLFLLVILSILQKFYNRKIVFSWSCHIKNCPEKFFLSLIKLCYLTFENWILLCYQRMTNILHVCWINGFYYSKFTIIIIESHVMYVFYKTNIRFYFPLMQKVISRVVKNFSRQI